MNYFAMTFQGFLRYDTEFSREIQKFAFEGMKRKKKIFVVVAILFFIATIIVGYDISTKTSFPGSKKYLKESIAPSEEEVKDSVNTKTK